MNKRNFFLIMLITAMAALLVACGPSDEKLLEAETLRNQLLAARETAEETYLDISDTTNKGVLDELSGRVSEFEAMDFTKMRDKKIDEVLPSIENLTQEYADVQKVLAETLSQETQIREEKEKHAELDAYFVNKTGMNLSKIVLHDTTQNSYSDSFLGEGVILNDGYTLMGPALDIYKDSSSWEFVVTDDTGTEYVLGCESLLGKETKGAVIILSYDKEKGVGEAQLSLQP